MNRPVFALVLLTCLALLALSALAAGPAADAAEPPQRKAYILFRSVFPDKEAIKPYGLAVYALAAEYDGHFIVLADEPQPVEGEPDTRRLVILEFPSLDAARAFWTSAAYAEVKKLREGIGEVEAVMFEGT